MKKMMAAASVCLLLSACVTAPAPNRQTFRSLNETGKYLHGFYFADGSLAVQALLTEAACAGTAVSLRSAGIAGGMTLGCGPDDRSAELPVRSSSSVISAKNEAACNWAVTSLGRNETCR